MIGFIGTGNMGSAMIEGLISSSICKDSDIIVSDLNKEALATLKKSFPNINTTSNNIECAQKANILILAVKPNIYNIVIDEIQSSTDPNTIIVSIAAGVKRKSIEEGFEKDIKLIRTMPNTPALVGEGMTALSPNKNVSEDELNRVKELFNSFGRTTILSEYLLDSYTALCGSSPAWVFMLIEALADGAVLEGMPRAGAYEMAAQAVYGSAKMVLESGKHPAELKDAVCSPGGTTIEAVASLEENGFRSTMIEAVRVCADKSRKLGD